MAPMGKMLMFMGGLLLVLGLVLTYGSRIFGPLGRLPGDIVVQRGNFTLYFPLATSILLSLALTLLFWLLRRFQ